MTLKDWLSNNLPTETRGGTTQVVYAHPTSGTCPECGVEHSGAVKEYIELSTLAGYGNYGTVYSNNSSTPKDDLVNEAKNNASGHERYFGQA